MGARGDRSHRRLPARTAHRQDGPVHNSTVDRGRPEMFARIRDSLISPSAAIIGLVVLSSCLIGCYELQAWPFGDHRTVRERYQFLRVSRTLLDPYLRAPGRVESSRRTVVRCELENMASTTGSASLSGGS